MKYINDFRSKSLHLKKRKAGELSFQVNGKDIPVVYPISPFLFKEVKSWKDRVLSGVPQLIIPFTVDQPFWAHRLFSKGYSVGTLKEKNLESFDLIKAFKDMENKEYIRNAKEIKNIIESEKGLENAVRYIEKVYKSF